MLPEKTTYEIPFSELLPPSDSLVREMNGGEDNNNTAYYIDVVDELVCGMLSHNPKAKGELKTYSYKKSDRTSNGLTINNVSFEIGDSIADTFDNAEYFAVFICTAGKIIDDFLKKYGEEDKILHAFYTELVGTYLVGKVMSRISADLESQVAPSGMSISHHYSPGYINWDIAQQELLFSFFKDNSCNIELTSSALMKPSKSVSGIIGIGKGIKKIVTRCSNCKPRNCIYRTTCGSVSQ